MEDPYSLTKRGDLVLVPQAFRDAFIRVNGLKEGELMVLERTIAEGLWAGSIKSDLLLEKMVSKGYLPE